MSDLNYITCPGCSRKIPISEALSHQIEERLKEEFQSKLKELELEKSKILEEQKKVHDELSQNFKKELEKEREVLSEKARKYLQETEEKLKQEATLNAERKLNLELEDLKKQNEEKESKLQEALKAEIQLRQEKRAIEEKEKNLEIELIRRVDEERKKIEESVQKQAADKFRIQELENVKKIQDLQKALEEAQRKAASGSVQIRGEVQELDLEELLKTNFIYDEIREVPKGINGADVIQEVRDNRGRVCGTIVWESKHTKAFNDKWIEKLKDDMILAKGQSAILVSETMPEDIKTFAFKNGVWVTCFDCVLEVAMVLRMHLMEMYRIEKINEGKGEKMEQVYNYLSSNEFRNKMQNIVETFINMKTDLESEKRAYQRMWANREKQILRIMENTATVVGDLQGYLGGSMPKIEGMELPGQLPIFN